MPKFPKLRISSVKRYREFELELKKAELSKINAYIKELEDRLEDAQKRLRDLEIRMNEVMKGKPDTRRVFLYNRARQNLKKEIVDIKMLLARAREEEERVKKEYMKAWQDLKTVEKVEERQKARLMEKYKKREASRMDEVASVQFNYRKGDY